MRRSLLLNGLLSGAAAALAFGLTALVRLHPWDLQVEAADGAVVRALDAEILDRAWERTPAAGGVGPPIVVIVLDTVRAANLELYGYPHATMPNLARRAAEARIYTRAVAESSWTLPTHASLFTGLPPRRHGAVGRTLRPGERQKRRKRKKRSLEAPLDDAFHTVAEQLWDQGYRTVGIAANRAYLRRTWNLHQGFDLWLCDDLPRDRTGLPYVRADRITALALRAVSRARAEGDPPLLLFLNYMDAHLPYVPRRGYVRDPGALRLRYREGAARGALVDDVHARERDLPEAVRAAWMEAYDAELRYLDAALERLFQGLEARGLLDEARVVVVGDHGEYFGEHHLVEHSKDLYEPALHVPLLVMGPDVTPGRDARPVQLADVAGWLVSWAEGRSPPVPDPDRLLVSELYGSRRRDLFDPRVGERFDRERFAFRRGDRKAILGSDGSRECYDLAVDPQESRSRCETPWARALLAEGQAWLAAPPPARRRTHVVLDPEVEEGLRGLGYIE